MKSILLSVLVWCVSPLVLVAAEPSAAAERLLAESRAALAAKDARRGVELAEQAVAADPARADLHAHLGNAYARRIGEVNFMHQAVMSGKMLGAYEKAVELDPDNLAGRIGLARYYTHAPAIAGGSREKAEAAAAELKQRHAFLGACEYGAIAEHFDDAERALVAYREAAELKPDDARVQERLGALHEKLGQTAAAREHYTRALALEPGRQGATEALARLGAAE